ncbi:MAG: hypothetical protein ACFFDK_01570 [Promethearchaeota archaeon]
MSSELNFSPENTLLFCPFSQSCILPKMECLCHFPSYKLCPDYQDKLKKLKSTSKNLY